MLMSGVLMDRGADGQWAAQVPCDVSQCAPHARVGHRVPGLESGRQPTASKQWPISYGVLARLWGGL